MTVRLPSEDELRARLTEHLRARPGDELVSATWNGYIASLQEWGVIEHDVYSRLLALLPEQGRLQSVEIALGPEYVDTHPELKDEVAAQTRKDAASRAIA